MPRPVLGPELEIKIVLGKEGGDQVRPSSIRNIYVIVNDMGRY